MIFIRILVAALIAFPLLLLVYVLSGPIVFLCYALGLETPCLELFKNIGVEVSKKVSVFIKRETNY